VFLGVTLLEWSGRSISVRFPRSSAVFGQRPESLAVFLSGSRYLE
jgi:hypothetical protein